jgi:hypothetical protein
MESIEESMAARLLEDEEDVGEEWTFEHDTVVHGLPHKHSISHDLNAPSIFMTLFIIFFPTTVCMLQEYPKNSH